MSLIAGAGEEDNSDDELLGQQSNNLGFTPTRTASEPVGYALRARSSSFAQKPEPNVQNALLRGAFRNFRLAVTGDTEIESVCNDIEAILQARDEGGDGRAASPRKKKGKRPAEPPLDLNLLRKHELDAMVLQGKIEAGAANLGAGFMGGTSKLAILMWLVVGAAGFAYTVRVLGEISTDYCERRVFPNGTIYEVHPQRGHCKWSWQYSTFFDVIEGILSGFGALCMWARAYFLYKKRVVLAHKALKYGCAVAGLAALYMAASPLSLPGIYQVGGPDAVLAQWWAGSLVFLIALQAFALLYQLHQEHRRNAQLIVITIVCTFAATAMAIGIGYHQPIGGVPATPLFKAIGTVSMALSVLALPVIGYLVYARRSKLKIADGFIRKDRERYDRVWKEMTQDGANVRQIQQLTSDVNAWKQENVIGGSNDGKRNSRPTGVTVVSSNGNGHSINNNDGLLEQRPQAESSPFGFYTSENTPARALTASVARELHKASVAANTTKPRQQICDLAVLFAQAATMNEYFQGVVSAWAGGLGAHVRHCPVKRRSRAIEKLFRSYHGDPGWLIDLVRASITFATIEALLACFQRIRADDRIAILNIKNRFDLGFNSAESAGYRNMSLSFIIVDDSTMHLGVDAHICELQLGCKAIDDFKNDEGHHNYVEWRNGRAE